MTRAALPALLIVLLAGSSGLGQGPGRRFTTIDALRQFPGFYHLQNVLIRGEFAEDGKVEHIWLSGVRYDGKRLHGRVGNAPVDLKRVREGDAHSMAPGEASDWMFIDEGKLVGGYSIRLLRSRMGVLERGQFDRSVPFRIE